MSEGFEISGSSRRMVFAILGALFALRLQILLLSTIWKHQAVISIPLRVRVRDCMVAGLSDISSPLIGLILYEEAGDTKSHILQGNEGSLRIKLATSSSDSSLGQV